MNERNKKKGGFETHPYPIEIISAFLRPDHPSLACPKVSRRVEGLRPIESRTYAPLRFFSSSINCGYFEEVTDAEVGVLKVRARPDLC